MGGSVGTRVSTRTKWVQMGVSLRTQGMDKAPGPTSVPSVPIRTTMQVIQPFHTYGSPRHDPYPMFDSWVCSEIRCPKLLLYGSVRFIIIFTIELATIGSFSGPHPKIMLKVIIIYYIIIYHHIPINTQLNPQYIPLNPVTLT